MPALGRAQTGLDATTADSTASVAASGAQPKRSHGLDDATLTSEPSADSTTSTQAPTVKVTSGSGTSMRPARPRMIAAATSQMTKATALDRRSRAGSTAVRPPHAARPSGAPAARAAWNTAITTKPTAEMAAADSTLTSREPAEA